MSWNWWLLTFLESIKSCFNEGIVEDVASATVLSLWIREKKMAAREGRNTGQQRQVIIEASYCGRSHQRIITSFFVRQERLTSKGSQDLFILNFSSIPMSILGVGSSLS